jgi:hypothetical protein
MRRRFTGGVRQSLQVISKRALVGVISAADKSLVDEFSRVSSRAEQMIARVNSCLNTTARVAPQFSMLGFLRVATPNSRPICRGDAGC